MTRFDIEQRIGYLSKEKFDITLRRILRANFRVFIYIAVLYLFLDPCLDHEVSNGKNFGLINVKSKVYCFSPYLK